MNYKLFRDYVKLSLVQESTFGMAMIGKYLSFTVKFLIEGGFWYLVFFVTGLNSFAGWSIIDLAVFILTKKIITGLFTMFFWGSFDIEEHVLYGLEEYLCRPYTHSLVPIFGEGFQIIEGSHHIMFATIGLLIIHIFFFRFSLVYILLSMIVLICGLVAIQFLNATLSVFSFYTGRWGFAQELLDKTEEFSQFPLDKSPTAVKYFFTVVIPIYLLNTLPAQILTYKIELMEAAIYAAGTAIMAVFWVYMAKHYFDRGLKNYMGAGG